LIRKLSLRKDVRLWQALQREVIALELVEIPRRPLAVICGAGEVFHGDGRSRIAMKA
jgi:hypothetical protein